MVMSDTEKERIENEIHEELKEAAHWYGGWKELRKVIDMLEDNEAEAAWQRQQERDLEGGYSKHEEAERMHKIQREVK